ncbi:MULTISPECIES: polyphosphate kinase 2 family protein [Lysinibacillus]|uniref:Polyphosphate kinase n=1 Tax=Lysinibacillus antri TaxID=2498145 RepID=A0A3S0WFS4_9BACI|nr:MULTISPECIES: polyphosphate kinase [Lysinibacillus]RUL51605.1 polyphosphate kinase [Lysinibacillus antri]TSI10646.1 polyphosphate kinase [Lysinibacillus sp. BW-2-10]
MKKIQEIDLSVTLDKKTYKKELKKLQYEMLNIQQFLYNNKIGLILAFEGMDAAGKGGAIKRLTQRLDPRGIIVHPISAPQPHELRYHYLQRFWRKLPQHGQIAVFDRTWYGRVLVERIEGFATEAEWKRAYEEINSFEKTLTDENYIIIKFWIHVDKEEQLKRFQERQTNPYKIWKLTDEDWRNRDKFDVYVQCADDMFERTDTPNAPWCLIAGNNKQHARIQVLTETIKRIEKEAKRRGLTISQDGKEVVNDNMVEEVNS